jgi:hypothetical protein
MCPVRWVDFLCSAIRIENAGPALASFLASSKLKLLHLAPALNHPGVLRRRITNDLLPFSDRDVFPPHEGSRERGRMVGSAAKNMDTIAPDTSRLLDELPHASTSQDVSGTPTVSCQRTPCRSSLQTGTALTTRWRVKRCQRCSRASTPHRALSSCAVA